MKIDRNPGIRVRPRQLQQPQANPEKTQIQAASDSVSISATKGDNPSLGKVAGGVAVAAAAGAIGGAVGAGAGEHMRLIMVGPPGAGKGTQSRFLLEDREGAHISTGAMLREEVANGTELGKKAKPYMDRGELVPDDIILDMVRGRLEKEDSFILDGFPRSVPQAEALDEMLEDMKKPLSSVVLLEVSDETILKRLLKRGRADDNEKTIRNRIEVYRQQTEPMVEYFRPQGLLETVNVEGSIKTNKELVADRVEGRLQNKTPDLSVPVPAEILTSLKPTLGLSVQDLVQNIDTHVSEGKAPYAPSWTAEQRETLTEKSKQFFNESLSVRPNLSLPELTEACRLHTEQETLGIQSSENKLKYGGIASALSAVATGIGIFTGNSTLSAIGGAALAGSIAFSAHSMYSGSTHKANVKAMAGTRDLVEGWSVSLSPPKEQPPEQSSQTGAN